MRIRTRGGAPRGAAARGGARAGAAAAATALALATLAACGSSGGSAAKPAANAATTSPAAPASTSTASPTPTPPPSTSAPSHTASTSSARLAPALLRLEDLPSGFRSERLTERNLPSLIKGCAGLEVLQQSGIGDQAQAEWTKGALDDYVDEAVIQPRGESAATLVDKAARALDACGSVKVVEEGLSVTLHAAPLSLPQIGTASHAWHTTAKYGIGSMEMNVVLIQQDDLVVLLAQTRINGQSKADLTLAAAQAAARRAAEFQKK